MSALHTTHTIIYFLKCSLLNTYRSLISKRLEGPPPDGPNGLDCPDAIIRDQNLLDAMIAAAKGDILLYGAMESIRHCTSSAQILNFAGEEGDMCLAGASPYVIPVGQSSTKMPKKCMSTIPNLVDINRCI